MASPDEGLDLNDVCQRYLPALAKHEGWPTGRLEHLMCTGEATQIALLLAMMLQQEGVTPAVLLAKIDSGEVSSHLRQLAEGTSSSQPQLFRDVGDLTPHVQTFFDLLAPYVPADARGFAVEFAAGCGFLAQNFARRWPGLQMYPTEHGGQETEQGIAGTGYLNWGLQQFAESPERDFDSLARRREQANVVEEQVNLLDTVWFPPTPPYPNSAQDAELSCQLWDRATSFDATADSLTDLATFEGVCRLVVCSRLLTHIGWRDPDAWKVMFKHAERLLSPGGILFVYDTAKWGGYFDRATMQEFLASEGAGLELLQLTAVPSKDDAMAMAVLRKTAPVGKPHDCKERALKAAVSFREKGNVCFNAVRDRKLQRAISYYTKALDCLAAGGWPDRTLASRLESNRSAALLEVQRFQEALRAADAAIHWDPTWAKAQYRRAKALAALGSDADAIAAAVNCELKDDAQAPVVADVAERDSGALSMPKPSRSAALPGVSCVAGCFGLVGLIADRLRAQRRR